MKATYEFRLDEDDATRVFGPGVGRALDGVRVVRLDGTDPRMGLLGQAYAQRRREGDGLFYSWDVRRSYDSVELDRAELIHLVVTNVFEPPGEDCGTHYDESAACTHCGAGRLQLSPLSLHLRLATGAGHTHESPAPWQESRQVHR